MRALVLSLILGCLSANAGIAATEGGFEKRLQEILDRNPDLASQRAELKAIESRNYPAKLFFLPQLSIEATAQNMGAENGMDIESRSLLGVAELNLFRFAADYHSLRSALWQEEQQEAQVLAVQLQVEAEGSRAIFSLIEKELILDILSRDRHIREESLRVALERYKRGLLAQEEVDKLVIDDQIAAARVVDAQIELAAARAKLLELLGESDVQMQWPWISKLDEVARADGSHPLLRPLGTDPSERPDWKSASAAYERANAQVGSGFGRVFPSLDFRASYGWVNSNNPASFGASSSDTYMQQWSAQVQLSVPLFDRLTRIGTYRAEVWEREKAQQNWIKIQRKSQQELYLYKNTFLLAVQTAQARERTRGIAKKLYERNLQRFKQGRMEVNSLALDETRLLDAERLAVQGWNAAHQSLVQLCHSLGKSVFTCL